MDDEIRVTVIATGFDDGPVTKAKDVKEREPSAPQGLFECGLRNGGRSASTGRAEKEEDPFDSIFKIFNSK